MNSFSSNGASLAWGRILALSSKARVLYIKLSDAKPFCSNITASLYEARANWPPPSANVSAIATSSFKSSLYTS